jgi:hypothetical protein
MKNFINKLCKHEQITLNELHTFILDYCKLMGTKEPNATELQQITQNIQAGFFDLNFACKIAAIKSGIQLNLLFDKHGNLIKMFIP